MKLIYLLRHAKSAWDDPEQADRDRPLAPRGRRAAKSIAQHLKTRDVAVDVVLCSPALRTRQTLELVAPALGGTPDVLVEEELYGAGPDDLMRRLRRLPDAAGSVLLVGHNPGLLELALRLAAPGAARERLEAGFPTAALATLAAPEDHWAAVRAGDAELLDYVVPRELD
jgi:phosphohistidine phosphatase